ncbi:DUF3368 domain-containing protein [Dolichospermum circinale]|uniref:DUF3368 domain-containing protein n=1 Tax=Dolichospermum circinale TaxID=109265 RepID=UPI000413649D|nr:DUF3368 domain-containing protein [Dolichospermum circinale]MDB9475917.1 DUF3368 domain-containing protein [Dolichospermum circinale CS-537/11]MDB9479475.1 DUF3368 domain-containing protein [Dolichospermum circinale CS-537/03]MDB9484257.1 DUF3368 domain-containing protein [Dolichospermum circinale CS-537/05]MDB9489128.1 DUF3368 domain-containing protein [Dolichospermum circinale CS-534/05]
MIVVSNTSPITNLAAIEQIELLQKLYKTIIIPQAVYDEMANLGYEVPGTKEVKTLAWIQTQPVNNSTLVAELKTEIDPGEAEAIALALEIKADRLIIDDYKGRVVATRLGLKVTGILGVLLVVKQRRLIENIKPVVNDLINIAGFHINPRLYTNILQTAGEE